MQKGITLRFIAIFLALYLPVITSGVPLHKHYCQGKLEKSQWLIEAESCHENENTALSDACCSTKSSCHSSPEDEEKQDDCCENEMDILKADIELVVQSIPLFQNDFSGQDLLFVRLHILTPALEKNNFSRIKPPDIFPYQNGQARLVAFQQFLC